MSVTSDRIRREFKAGDDVRDAGLMTPESVIRYDDLYYGEDKEWQKLDVYRPREADEQLLPVIVSVHGGGWVYGDKERYQYYCMELARRGFAVVNFTYRLAPEFKHPAPLEDTNLVFQWIKEHCTEYKMDVERIFAVGDSAGGHLLGLYAAIWTNPEYAKEYNFSVPTGMCLKAIALNCGVFRVYEKVENFDEMEALMADYLPLGGTTEELNMLDVPSYVTENYPPTFLMTSVADFLKNQVLLMVEKFMEYDVPFVYRFYGDRKNQLAHVFHCNIRTEDAKVCNDEECGFFQSFC